MIIRRASNQTPTKLFSKRRPINAAISSLCTGILLLTTHTQPVLAESNNSTREPTRSFTIPATSLSDALLQFSETSGQKVLFNADMVRGLSTQGLQGKFSSQQALQKLLAGSGLTPRKTASGSITLEKMPQVAKPAKPVKRASQPNPVDSLPTITVSGKADYDVKDPYNPDYVLPNATAGTKTDTPIMETPLNVQVVSKQVMKDRQVITLAESLKNVSGVIANNQGNEGDFTANSGSETGITIRGFASTTTLRNGFRIQGGANRNMSNVESIEVLKGPAAILYGLVEPGGMVNVVTKQPLASPYYALNQQFGSYDFYRTTVDATGPLTKDNTLLYRMNMSYQNSGSYQNYAGQEDIFLAPVLKWNISPRTQVTAEFEYNRQHQGLVTSFNPYIDGQLLKTPLSFNYGAYSPAVTETFFGNINWSHQFNDDWAIKHNFSVNQQSFTANRTVSPVITTTNDVIDGLLFGPQSNPISGLGVLRSLQGSVSQFNTYSTNLDLTGHFDTFGLKHTFLLGGDYYRLNNSSAVIRNNDLQKWSIVDPYNPVNPGLPVDMTGGDQGSTQQQQTDQYGLYVQDQIKLPYDVHVTGGIRYQNIHQNTINTSAGNPGSSITFSQDAVTPRVGILWHPQSWLSLYANYAESFGTNTGLVWSATGQFTPVAPTSATQYEGGIKTEFFDGRLRATLAYYDLTKTNVAANDADLSHDCGNGPGSCSLAIGAFRSRGPELDIQGELLPGWNAIATWANTDILVTKGNSTFTGYNVGDRLRNVPRNTASFWSTYELQNTALKGLKFGGGVTIRQGQIGSGGGDISGTPLPVIKTPGYATLDLMTAYSRAIGKSKITVQFNITNLLDKRYFTNINASFNDPAFQAFGAYAPYGAPRTAMGSISIQY